MASLRSGMLLLVLVCGGACSYLNTSQPYGEGYPAVREIDPLLRRLQAADAASSHVALTEIGRVSYGGFDAPVWRVAYRPFQAELKHVLILAAVHGTDAAGVEFTAGLVDRLAGSAPGSAPYDLDIIPIVNPWGWVHDLAFNRDGVDIVSDFVAFDSQEARLMRRFLREKRYDLVIELREDPAASGFFIQRYGTEDAGVSAEIVSRIRHAGYSIAGGLDPLQLRPRDGTADVSLWRVRLMRIFRQMTFAGYIRQNAGNRVLTVLTPEALPLADRVVMQRIAVETLLDGYASTR